MCDLSKFTGCFLGGAIGDALGYEVEFQSASHIFASYGPRGITRYRLRDGLARISDDTQMTLFTAAGLLFGETRALLRGTALAPQAYIRDAYLDWLDTQEEDFPLRDNRFHCAWFVNYPEFFARRAPGNTCMSALWQGGHGSTQAPINNSCGCGGVMRVAPVGLFFANRADPTGLEAVRLGAEAAAITHGHELGWLPGAVLAQTVCLLASGKSPDVATAVMEAMDATERVFPQAEKLSALREILEKALGLAAKAENDVEAIHSIGGGWVGDQALAIAVYCAVKYQDDFEACMVASVNHSGDSDSTGAIAGNILGAFLGAEVLPACYLENLELKDVLREVAQDLWQGCPADQYGALTDPAWISKYVDVDRKP